MIVAEDGTTVLWTPNCYVTEASGLPRSRRPPRSRRSRPRPPAAPAPTATPAPQTYTVQRGDTLSAIAKRFYGHASEYRRIAAANNIANPDLIHPGQQLVIPTPTGAPDEPKRLGASSAPKATFGTPSRPDQPASTTFPSSTGDASSGLCGSTRTV